MIDRDRPATAGRTLAHNAHGPIQAIPQGRRVHGGVP